MNGLAEPLEFGARKTEDLNKINFLFYYTNFISTVKIDI